MNATLTTPARPTTDVCPPWCSGHDARWQPWETYDNTPQRPHDSQSLGNSEVSVMVTQMENADRTFSKPLVMIADNTPGLAGCSEMSAEDADEVAETIRRAAVMVRDWQRKHQPVTA